MLLAAALAAACGAVHADAIDAGRAKAQSCTACHGALGLATLPDAPNLAGQSPIYLTAQLRAFRSGARKHEVMSVVARTLSDDDIDDLAAWFASIQVQATAPR
ncbi:MAG: cytochrome c [Burkholderiales bacterium]|nr:cytochrome c [Burkholderiales bacterium]MDE2157873.1 cytochrome c [Burkholderiales bacterium]MDE2503189.1 cytochrome c [Burkholderiales bacterium]